MIKKTFSYLASFTFLVILNLIPLCNYAQKSVVSIVHAENLRGFKTPEGVSIQVLTGEVELIHDGTRFFCDSVRLNKDQNLFNAFGKIHAIMKDSVELFGSKLNYNGNTKIAEVFRNVKLIDDTTTLTTDYLIYNRLSKIGIYNTGGKIVDTKNELISKVGRFYTDTDEYYFQDSVVVTSPDYVIETDTLTYFTQTETAYFKGPTTLTGEEDFMFALSGWSNTKNKTTSLKNKALLRHDRQVLRGDSIFYDDKNDYGRVFENCSMLDPEKKVLIYGNYLDYKYEDKDYAYALDSSQAILYNEEDSLYLHADTLKIQFDDENKTKRLLAYYGARFYKKDMQGACDSLVYEMQDSTIRMLKDPIVWSDANQLTSDSMFIYISNNQPDSLSLIGSSFICSEDTLSSYNQISGRTVWGYFLNKELHRITVNGNSETIYFIRDDETSDLLGINKAASSNMIIRMEDQKIKTITYINQPKATLYPESELTMGDRTLSGFQWRINERPLSKEDIFKP